MFSGLEIEVDSHGHTLPSHHRSLQPISGARTGICDNDSDNCLSDDVSHEERFLWSNTPPTSQHDLKQRKIEAALGQCESQRFPAIRKPRIALNYLDLNSSDLTPVVNACSSKLGRTLHTIELKGNLFRTIPGEFVQRFPALKSLDLSGCEIRQLPRRWNLPQLSRLNLSNNSLTEFPHESILVGLPKLKELNLYGNELAVISLPNAKSKALVQLEKLDLGYNDLVGLPFDLNQLRSLKRIILCNNLLSKIPAHICRMNLVHIDVSSNPLLEPPVETCTRGIWYMRKYWKCIELEENSKFRAAVHYYQQQRNKQENSATGRVKLIASQQVSIDELRQRRIKLLVLKQGKRSGVGFQKSTLSLKNLDVALLLPVGTYLRKTLHTLSLSGNKLSAVPDELVCHMNSLKHLDLSRCELTDLPRKWDLPMLAYLNLSRNGISEFPNKSILNGLPELRELNLFGNCILEISLPHCTRKQSVLSLRKLEELDMGYNDLLYIPDELDRLTSLKTLRLGCNFLYIIPSRVCNMKLKVLDVSFNPTVQPPVQVCERGTRWMQLYWKNQNLLPSKDIFGRSSSSATQVDSSGSASVVKPGK